MKYCAIAFLALLTASAKAQETPVKRNEYKMISITYSSFSKPRSSDLYGSDRLLSPNTYDDLKRNVGISLKYSQMNFIKNKNCGLEFGIGTELLMISKQFNFDLPTDPDPSNVSLGSYRSNTATVNIPLYYVHRIELGNHFTLFPKIGADARVLITNPEIGYGVNTDSLNNLHYNSSFRTTQYYANGSFQNVFLNGTIGASLNWSTKNGGSFGLQMAFSAQLLRNTLLTRIKDIQYKKDGEVVFDSNQDGGDYYYQNENGQLVYQPPTKISDFLAENKMTNFSIGLSYVFGK